MPKGQFRTRGQNDEDKPRKWAARGGVIMSDRGPHRCYYRVNGWQCHRIVPPEGTHFQDFYACPEHSSALEHLAWQDVDTQLRREEAAQWSIDGSGEKKRAVPA